MNLRFLLVAALAAPAAFAAEAPADAGPKTFSTTLDAERSTRNACISTRARSAPTNGRPTRRSTSTSTTTRARKSSTP
jgi:hypothetical protein